MAAITNHIRYGICKYPAVLFLDRKSLIIIITSNISSKIQINANINNLNLKKINDHSRLTTNWYIYILGISLVSLYIIYDDIPINIYNIVHTIGNTHDGIILSMLAFGTVNIPTRAPNNNGTSINIKSLL